MANRKFFDMVKEMATYLESNPLKMDAAKAQCNNQKTYKELFSFIWDFVEAEDSEEILTTPFIVPEKSKEKADRLRKSGNEHFQEKNYLLSLRDYNLSIMNAPHPILRRSRNEAKTESHDFPYIDPANYGGTEGECKMLAVGFANRSVVLFEMELYEECLNDIELAFEYGYPNALRAKLNERKEKCLSLMNSLDFKQKESRNSGESNLASTAEIIAESHFDIVASANAGDSQLGAGATDNLDELLLSLIITDNFGESPMDSRATENSGDSPPDAVARVNYCDSPLGVGDMECFDELPLVVNDTHDAAPSPYAGSATGNSGELPIDGHYAVQYGASIIDAGATEKSGESLDGAGILEKFGEIRLCSDATAAKLSNEDTGFMVNNLLPLTPASLPPAEISSPSQLSSNETKYEIKKPPSLTMPQFADSIKLGFKPSKERCLIAARDLKPGEILGAEEAFSVNIDIPELHLYCSTCVKKCLNPLPCPSCAQVVFCSESCRTKGLSEEHWLECKILPTLISIDFTTRNMAIKMLRTLSYPKLNDLLDNFEKDTTNPPEDLECCSDGVYRDESYRTVYSLRTNKDQYSFQFLFTQCMISYIFIELLYQSRRFFVDENRDPLHPTRVAIVRTGATLLSHSVKLHGNLFQISDRATKKSIGTGFFPLLSSLRTSDNPNIRHYSCGRLRELRAISAITAGEELAIACT